MSLTFPRVYPPSDTEPPRDPELANAVCKAFSTALSKYRGIVVTAHHSIALNRTIVQASRRGADGEAWDSPSNGVHLAEILGDVVLVNGRRVDVHEVPALIADPITSARLRHVAESLTQRHNDELPRAQPRNIRTVIGAGW